MSESKIVQRASAKNVESLSSLHVIHFGSYSTFRLYCIINTKKKKHWKESLEKGLE